MSAAPADTQGPAAPVAGLDRASHGLTIDHTGRKSCDIALEFVERFV
jgi:hypothetical protein